MFDFFFSPKRFVGANFDPQQAPSVDVETPDGILDVDDLSDGEKEILHTMVHLYRFSDLQNTILWDTPELHLNAALEGRLYQALTRIAPGNQYWIATHSVELINSVPLENVFVIRPSAEGAVLTGAADPSRKARVEMYRELGAQVGLQLVSSVVVFCEGKDAYSDKRCFDRLVAPSAPGVNFLAGGSCETVLAAGTRANELLAEATQNGDFLAVVDRDYRSDEQIEAVEKRYGPRLFMLRVHEIENIFLAPEIVHETLRFLDRLEGQQSVDDLTRRLREVAVGLRDWFVADWIAWDFHQRFQRPPRRIAGDDPEASLRNYVSELRSRVRESTSDADVEKQKEQKRREVDQLIENDRALTRLPGKQLLQRFLERFGDLSAELYISSAVSTILDKDLRVPEIERLKKVIDDIRGST